ncbi:MAG: hypothetical protein HDR01_08855 [Lachnospiraceae bacterium]|nr:hypothetical protein [Lachnospiraceae bacterium]
MTVIEIVLCLAGIALCIISFLLPDKQKEAGEPDKEAVQEMVTALVEEEISGAKAKLEEMQEETISYGMEKTERSLEKVTNEKIIAVSEYAETVIEDINKNHKEVMFLYDMLNSKHENLKETVVEVSQTAKEAEKTVQVLEDTAKKVETTLQVQEGQEEEETEAFEFEPLDVIDFSSLTPIKERKKNPPKRNKEEKESKISIQFEGSDNKNSNEKILELYDMGKSNMAIAKELGLGVGEVNLVIDLYKGI